MSNSAVVTVHGAKYAQPAAAQRNPGRGQSRSNSRSRSPGFEEFLKQFGGDAQIPDQSDQPREGSGSGFIVSKDGYILTNNHVVAGMDKVQVILTDKRTFTAKVIGTDPTTDVAVIKIDGDDFPTVPLGDDATARVGQWVLAVGNPLELDFTVTAGIISAKGRSNPLPGRDSYRIRTSSRPTRRSTPGNSGGPLVNIRGEVIGINSAIASQTGYYSGYGFAIPIGLAHQVMNDLIKYGAVKRAVVGVSLQEVTPEDAQAAGMKEDPRRQGRRLHRRRARRSAPASRSATSSSAADGKPIDQVSTLQRIIRGFTVGQTVQLDIQRFGQRKQIAIKLTEAKAVVDQVADNGDGNAPAGSRGRKVAPAEASKSFDKLGMTVSALPAATITEANVPASARDGLLITNVEPRSDAWTKQVTKNYDVIEQVLYPVRRDIKSMSDLDAGGFGPEVGRRHHPTPVHARRGQQGRLAPHSVSAPPNARSAWWLCHQALRLSIGYSSGAQGGSGEIGRRTRLRIWRRKAWGFESPLSH